jgi:PilZ domain-containing protein
MQTQRQRADVMMDSKDAEQRVSMRRRVNVCGEVVCPEPGCPKHLALIRDVSASGIFLYCNLDPAVGTDLSVAFTMPGAEGYVEVICQGKVIRREEYPAGAATGIAARLYKQEILPLS